MKLDYRNDTEGSIVLMRASHRVELHRCRLDNELFCLVAFSGADHAQPDKMKLQGPYHHSGQLQAAINAISSALLKQTYTLSQTPLIWGIQAQKALRQSRIERASHFVNTAFVPLGTMPEHPETDA